MGIKGLGKGRADQSRTQSHCREKIHPFPSPCPFEKLTPFQAEAEEIALVLWSRGSGNLVPYVCPASHPVLLVLESYTWQS